MNKQELLELFLKIYKSIGAVPRREDIREYCKQHNISSHKIEESYKKLYGSLQKALIAANIADESYFKGRNDIKGNEVIGTASEYYVLSELLFRGYNAAKLAIDEGLDIFAVKNGQSLYVQVKHVKLPSGEIRLQASSLLKNEGKGVFYFILTRNNDNKDIYIVPKFIFEKLFNFNLPDSGETRMNFYLKENKAYLSYKGKQEEITDYKNQWLSFHL